MGCNNCNTSKCSCETTICTSPLIYAMKSVFSLVDGNANLPTVISDVLTGGISISNNKNLCCPDCSAGIYYLGNAAEFISIFNADQVNKPNPCCIEHYSSAAVWQSILDLNVTTNCCDTDFSQAVQNWISESATTSVAFDLDTVVNGGIIESSSFGGYSGLGIIFDFLKLNHPELTATDYLNIFGSIMNEGLVVSCKGCEIFISSAATYIQYKLN